MEDSNLHQQLLESLNHLCDLYPNIDRNMIVGRAPRPTYSDKDLELFNQYFDLAQNLINGTANEESGFNKFER